MNIMLSYSTLLLPLVFLTYAVAHAHPKTSHKSINWFPCEQNGSLPLTCGTLTVPLDYSIPTSNLTLELALIKVGAVKHPKKGSILFNPGGPGDSGREFIASAYAAALLVATGGSYDLIGFDTRGTGNTIPYSCYNGSYDRTIAQTRTPPFLNSSDIAIGTIWAAKTIFAESCYKNAKDIGQLVGTSFVARDMMQIVDGLHEDGLLRYWGFSYGTALGVTVAAMFPERMDKVVLDGVLNPKEYYAGRDVEEVTDSDATFAGFFKNCAANPDNCALAQNGKTAEQLSQSIYNLLYTIKYHPLGVGSDISVGIIDYGALKAGIVAALYNTIFWPGLASAFNGLLTGNITAVFEFAAEILNTSSVYPSHGYEAIYGIRCSDSSLRTTNLTTLYPLIEEFYAKSILYGDVLTVTPLTCAQWPFIAKERYTGDFCAKTKNPILFIGNTFDPLTPLVSAYNASAGFEGSVVLQHDGYGHTSLGQPSLCTAKAVRDYFEHGILPISGTKCEPSIVPFSNETIAEALAPIANLSRRGLETNDNDAMLMASLIQLNQKLPFVLKF